MIKRPKNLTTESMISVQSKFNSILEERLFDGNANNHYLISIDVDLGEFHPDGGLTCTGMELFWKDLN